ncbi:Hypothetical protein FORC64_p296 (plasmid) [Escherichia coli]|nr:Hypothetical protein FORC64_p296 [Escherichia coli]
MSNDIYCYTSAYFWEKITIIACLSTYHFTATKPCAQHCIFSPESFPKLTDMVTI